MRRGNEPSASVMVNLLPGVRLNERQLAGIIHLVASSIPNLDSARVSVVDQAGKFCRARVKIQTLAIPPSNSDWLSNLRTP